MNGQYPADPEHSPKHFREVQDSQIQFYFYTTLKNPLFQALILLSHDINNFRARLNCDFEVPSVIFSFTAISLCVYPSKAYRLKTNLAPSGNRLTWFNTSSV